MSIERDARPITPQHAVGIPNHGAGRAALSIRIHSQSPSAAAPPPPPMVTATTDRQLRHDPSSAHKARRRGISSSCHPPGAALPHASTCDLRSGTRRPQWSRRRLETGAATCRTRLASLAQSPCRPPCRRSLTRCLRYPDCCWNPHPLFGPPGASMAACSAFNHQHDISVSFSSRWTERCRTGDFPRDQQTAC
jgi:hypothetical protein